MPWYGIVASRRPLQNYLYDELLKHIESLSLDTVLSECFLSNTGSVVFKFQDAIVRLGVTSVVNKRVRGNANNLIEIRNYLSDSHAEKIPSVLKFGKINIYEYCIETKLKGVDAKTLIYRPEFKKAMTIEAVDFLIEFTRNTRVRARIDKRLLTDCIGEPLERIYSIVKKHEYKVIFLEIVHIVTKRLLNEQIPFVLFHTRFKHLYHEID